MSRSLADAGGFIGFAIDRADSDPPRNGPHSATDKRSPASAWFIGLCDVEIGNERRGFGLRIKTIPRVDQDFSAVGTSGTPLSPPREVNSISLPADHRVGASKAEMNLKERVLSVRNQSTVRSPFFGEVWTIFHNRRGTLARDGGRTSARQPPV